MIPEGAEEEKNAVGVSCGREVSARPDQRATRSSAAVCVQTSPPSDWGGSRPHVKQAAHTDMHSHCQATMQALNVAEHTPRLPAGKTRSQRTINRLSG